MLWLQLLVPGCRHFSQCHFVLPGRDAQTTTTLMLSAPLLLQQSSEQQRLAPDTAVHLGGIAKAKAFE